MINFRRLCTKFSLFNEQLMYKGNNTLVTSDDNELRKDVVDDILQDSSDFGKAVVTFTFL